uniref:Uncharacterized protein n=1 Tax=Chromera velia CCMP2878 TaxID=1169474 RepID=A0A0G4HSN7_9ALVE|eukprot:Cvel_8327.t1-p1 / transcript=Cvel_8327.t1 / gene=Cvel_8327 / organism=Chromera_velia_CCMP2878 / gene_product=hypothetical protein / transcript_product=hypothetical protein / location=Cvel_scaffold458:8255-13928(+) / protein_length=1363 / sequence_SO=supercontig / SO=protein_coding / is_pseudo=false
MNVLIQTALSGVQDVQGKALYQALTALKAPNSHVADFELVASVLARKFIADPPDLGAKADAYALIRLYLHRVSSASGDVEDDARTSLILLQRAATGFAPHAKDGPPGVLADFTHVISDALLSGALLTEGPSGLPAEVRALARSRGKQQGGRPVGLLFFDVCEAAWRFMAEWMSPLECLRFLTMDSGAQASVLLSAAASCEERERGDSPSADRQRRGDGPARVALAATAVEALGCIVMGSMEEAGGETLDDVGEVLRTLIKMSASTPSPVPIPISRVPPRGSPLLPSFAAQRVASALLFALACPSQSGDDSLPSPFPAALVLPGRPLRSGLEAVTAAVTPALLHAAAMQVSALGSEGLEAALRSVWEGGDLRVPFQDERGGVEGGALPPSLAGMDAASLAAATSDREERMALRAFPPIQAVEAEAYRLTLVALVAIARRPLLLSPERRSRGGGGSPTEAHSLQAGGEDSEEEIELRSLCRNLRSCLETIQRVFASLVMRAGERAEGPSGIAIAFSLIEVRVLLSLSALIDSGRAGPSSSERGNAREQSEDLAAAVCRCCRRVERWEREWLVPRPGSSRGPVRSVGFDLHVERLIDTATALCLTAVEAGLWFYRQRSEGGGDGGEAGVWGEACAAVLSLWADRQQIERGQQGSAADSDRGLSHVSSVMSVCSVLVRWGCARVGDGVGFRVLETFLKKRLAREQTSVQSREGVGVCESALFWILCMSSCAHGSRFLPPPEESSTLVSPDGREKGSSVRQKLREFRNRVWKQPTDTDGDAGVDEERWVQSALSILSAALELLGGVRGDRHYGCLSSGICSMLLQVGAVAGRRRSVCSRVIQQGSTEVGAVFGTVSSILQSCSENANSRTGTGSGGLRRLLRCGLPLAVGVLNMGGVAGAGTSSSQSLSMASGEAMRFLRTVTEMRVISEDSAAGRIVSGLLASGQSRVTHTQPPCVCLQSLSEEELQGALATHRLWESVLGDQGGGGGRFPGEAYSRGRLVCVSRGALVISCRISRTRSTDTMKVPSPFLVCRLLNATDCALPCIRLAVSVSISSNGNAQSSSSSAVFRSRVSRKRTLGEIASGDAVVNVLPLQLSSWGGNGGGQTGRGPFISSEGAPTVFSLSANVSAEFAIGEEDESGGGMLGISGGGDVSPAYQRDRAGSLHGSQAGENATEGGDAQGESVQIPAGEGAAAWMHTYAPDNVVRQPSSPVFGGLDLFFSPFFGFGPGIPSGVLSAVGGTGASEGLSDSRFFRSSHAALHSFAPWLHVCGEVALDVDEARLFMPPSFHLVCESEGARLLAGLSWDGTAVVVLLLSFPERGREHLGGGANVKGPLGGCTVLSNEDVLGASVVSNFPHFVTAELQQAL